MLMVIFGAGASYDSVPTYPPGAPVPGGDAPNNYFRPPLANEMFANRPLFAKTITYYPECQPIVPRLRSLRDESLEAVLQDLQAKAEDYPRGHQQLAAVRFYLRHLLSDCVGNWRNVALGVTNYKSLLDAIERGNRKSEPVCIVTFNYDTLLEDALRDFGLSIEGIRDYTKKHSFYRVFKVHGSVNWARQVETKLRTQNLGDQWAVNRELIERAAELQFNDAYILNPPGSVGAVDGKPVFPAIAIPVEKKARFECPAEMLEGLAELLPRVSKLLAIGWRATETHFLGLLGNRLTGLRGGVPLHIVAGSKAEAEETQARIHRALLNNEPNSSLDPGGFTDFILSRRAEQQFIGN
jgi:hypothetical protein